MRESVDVNSAAPVDEFRAILNDAIRYWERRRIVYNAVLVAIVFAWVALSWPHFVPVFRWSLVVALLVLAMLANLCYSAAYVADLPLQYSALRRTWLRWRWGLWLTGMLFAAMLANFWVADQIYAVRF